MVCVEQIASHILSVSDEMRRPDINLNVTDSRPENIDVGSPSKVLPFPDNNNQYLKIGIFECSVALHSIIIGFDLGSLGAEDISTITSLMIALAFHQYFEGFALGTIQYSFHFPSLFTSTLC